MLKHYEHSTAIAPAPTKTQVLTSEKKPKKSIRKIIIAHYYAHLQIFTMITNSNISRNCNVIILAR